MKYKVGDKVKIVQFTETYLDAPEETIGNIGTVDAIRLDQDDYIYRVTFENDPEGWNYKEDQLEHIDGMKNVQVKQLYVLWVSDEGDKKLIPNHEYDDFKSNLREVELLLDNEVLYTATEDQCEDRMYELRQDIYDLIDQYDTLEGEEVFVVLPDDVIKGDKD